MGMHFCRSHYVFLECRARELYKWWKIGDIAAFTDYFDKKMAERQLLALVGYIYARRVHEDEQSVRNIQRIDQEITATMSVLHAAIT